MATIATLTVKINADTSSFRKGMGMATAALGTVATVGVAAAAAAGAALIGVAAISVKSAISMESAWTGVVKTTDGLVDAEGKLTVVGAELQKGFRDLSKTVPTSIEDLFAIGELGGQLGIAKEGLLDFTQVIANLGETTNLSTEEAALSLARMSNIMGTSQADFGRLGSVIVGLGNNFATTERDIVAYTERVAGIAQLAGITEAQTLAIGAAFSSVGVQAQAGGTAIQKTLISMTEAVATGGEDLEVFAKTAGVTAKEFAASFKEDAGLAFAEFVKGLGVAGDDAFAILDELGLKNSQSVRALLSVAGAGDLLTDAMTLANKAWDENTALTKEAELRYGTFASQAKIVKNQFKDVMNTIGTALLPVLGKMLTAITPLINALGEKLGPIMENVVVPAIEKFLIPAFEFLIGLLKGEGLSVLTNFPLSFEPIISGVKKIADAFQEHWPAMKAAALDMIDWFSTNVVPVIQTVIDTIGRILSMLAAQWEKHGEKVIAVVAFAFKLVATVIGGAVTLIMGIVNVFLDILNGDWAAAWETIKDTAKKFIELALSLVGQSLDDFVGTWTRNWEMLKTIVSAVWDGIKKAIGDSIRGILTSIESFVSDAVSAFEDFTGIKIPSWMLGGSPSPLEMSFRGMTNALREFSRTQLPQFSGMPAMAPAAVGGVSGRASAAGGVTFTGDIQFNVPEGMNGRQLFDEFMREAAKRTREARASGAGTVGV